MQLPMSSGNLIMVIYCWMVSSCTLVSSERSFKISLLFPNSLKRLLVSKVQEISLFWFAIPYFLFLYSDDWIKTMDCFMIIWCHPFEMGKLICSLLFLVHVLHKLESPFTSQYTKRKDYKWTIGKSNSK